jgi:ectoine hydroxylase-related dioxygenase (phytanoyl-CoA dioxygenase family)
MAFNLEIIKYDIDKYPFAKIVRNFLNINSLENIQDNYKFSSDIKGIGSDTQTSAHEIFYTHLNKKNSEILSLYYKFISDVLFKKFDDQILFQSKPGFRIQNLKNKAVSTWHSDGDESNKHPYGEINIFLPLTRAFGNNSIWIESEPDKQDYHPVKLDYGEFLIFDGNNCKHGNYKNDTNITRVSFDFRILKREDYNPNYPVKTATMGLSYVIGEYYMDQYSISNL